MAGGELKQLHVSTCSTRSYNQIITTLAIPSICILHSLHENLSACVFAHQCLCLPPQGGLQIRRGATVRRQIGKFCISKQCSSTRVHGAPYGTPQLPQGCLSEKGCIGVHHKKAINP